jgi:hypothetical protein
MTNEEAQAEIDRFAAEDAAADAAIKFFKALGRSHAAFAIDADADYEDSRESHRQNLSDTLWEQHRDATSYQVEVAIDAYNAAWDAVAQRERAEQAAYEAEASYDHFNRYIAGDR